MLSILNSYLVYPACRFSIGMIFALSLSLSLSLHYLTSITYYTNRCHAWRRAQSFLGLHRLGLCGESLIRSILCGGAFLFSVSLPGTATPNPMLTLSQGSGFSPETYFHNVALPKAWLLSN